MIRIEHDTKLDVVCIVWRDVKQLFFRAEHRRLSSILLFEGTTRLELADEDRAVPIAAVLATKDGKPDWHQGVGVVLNVTEAGQTTSDFLINVINLALREDLIDAHAADQARHEVLLITAIRK